MSLHYRYPQIVRPPELVPNTISTAGEEDKARLRGPLSYFFFRYLLWPESCHALVSVDRGPADGKKGISVPIFGKVNEKTGVITSLSVGQGIAGRSIGVPRKQTSSA